MSRKGSAVRGDPTDDIGNPVLEQDDQGREEMSTSLNSGTEHGAGVQSTSTQPTLSPDRGVNLGREARLRVRVSKRRLTL